MDKLIIAVVIVALIASAIFNIAFKTVVICGHFNNGEMDTTVRYEDCSIDSTGAIECIGKFGKILPNRSETCMETYEVRK